MSISRMVVRLGIVVGILLASAAPALANFHSKSSTGKGDSLALMLEAGGGKLACYMSTEGGSPVSWTIDKSGKEASTEGPTLSMLVQKWGHCQVADSFIKEEASLAECELQLKQVEGNKAVLSIVKTCTMKATGCELLLESGTNKELGGAEFADSETGSAENLTVGGSVKGVTTKVASGCLGVESSKAGVIKGDMEMLSMQAGTNDPEFAMVVEVANGNEVLFGAAGETGKIKVRNVSATEQTISSWTLSEEPPTSFKPKVTDENTCKSKRYMAAGNGAGSVCEFETELTSAGVVNMGYVQTYILKGQNGVANERALLGFIQ